MSVLYVGGDAADNSGFSAAGKTRFVSFGSSGEYGYQISLINKTGASTTKGYLVSPNATTDFSFFYTSVDMPDIIGVIAEAGIADGSYCWVWTGGMCQVYCTASASAGNFVRSVATGDGDTTSGRATAETRPSSPFATDKHFQEVGHVVEGTSATGLTMAVLHFN